MASFDRAVVQEPFMGRPHLVVLGAGATMAAFPDGDRNGRKLPLMHNVVEVCGLQSILDKHNINYVGNDFEAFFSALFVDGQAPEAVQDIEQAIFSYFATMELPDEPTLYDHLVLSLRPKDVIATFNWDPFLVRAIARNASFAEMPNVLFLHGNVGIGHCMRHRPASIGNRGRWCHQCHEPLDDSKLLYPVGQKDYNADPFIKLTWDLVQRALSDAFLVTFFGYSAPKTDVEAIRLFKAGWGSPEKRSMEEVELIDIKDEETTYATWKPFIHTHHYTYASSFYDSLITHHPRRSCDAMFRQNLDAEFIGANPLPQAASWSELYAWLRPLLEDEQSYAAKQTGN